MAHCKDCHNTHSAEKWRNATPEDRAKRRAWVRGWYERNNEQLRAWRRDYLRRDPEKWHRYFREWDRQHRAYRHAYKAAHIEHAREVARQWRERIADRVKQQLVAYYASHKPDFKARGHTRRARVRQAPGTWTAAEWEAIKESHGYRCLCCGRAEPEIQLTVDHVIPLARGGSNDATNLQPLCRRCNIRKNARAIDYRSQAS